MISYDVSPENLLEGFRLSCQAEGKSPRTVEWYYAFTARFFKFLKQNSLPVTLISIQKQHVRGFIRYLQEEARVPRVNSPLSPATVQGYVRSLKAFFSWAERESYIETNIMRGIPVPKAPSKVINTFSSEQLIRFINLCRDDEATGKRNLVIILLLLDSGLRVSECCAIELSDIDLESGVIKVRRGKGYKERIVPIGSLVQKAVWKYINQYRPRPLTKQVTELFLSGRGLPLTRNGIQQMLRRYSRRAGIRGVRCSPHTLRHTFAKNYLLNGGDIFSLQKILGHSSLASVRAYLNLFSGDIKRQHDRFSPVDNLSGRPEFRRI